MTHTLAAILAALAASALLYLCIRNRNDGDGPTASAPVLRFDEHGEVIRCP